MAPDLYLFHSGFHSFPSQAQQVRQYCTGLLLDVTRTHAHTRSEDREIHTNKKELFDVTLLSAGTGEECWTVTSPPAPEPRAAWRWLAAQGPVLDWLGWLGWLGWPLLRSHCRFWKHRHEKLSERMHQRGFTNNLSPFFFCNRLGGYG